MVQRCIDCENEILITHLILTNHSALCVIHSGHSHE